MAANRYKLFKSTCVLLISLLVLFSVTVVFAKDEASRENHPRLIDTGEIPPDFTIEDVEGVEFALADFVDDKPVIIDFWATWCNPCRMEMPLLNEFAEMYGDEVEVVGITSEAAESAEAVETFIADYVYIRYIHDPSGEISRSYNVTGIPFLVVIGDDGIILKTHLGYSETIIDELVEDLGLE